MASRREGFMDIPEGFTMGDYGRFQRFAEVTGIGPVFRNQPRHHGQHSWCCPDCNAWRKEKARPKNVARQPWEVSISLVNTNDRERKHDADSLEFNTADNAHMYWWVRGYSGPFVYFIQPAGRPNDPIKIGMGKNPQTRLKTFQTAYPLKLNILCVIPGGQQLERCLHEVFKDSNSHGEWFVGPAVHVIIAVARTLRDKMQLAHMETGEVPDPPNLHELTNLAGATRRRIAGTRQLAA